MAKIKTAYFCQNCGNSSPKWQGKCSACGEWNTYVEEVVQKEEPGKKAWRKTESGTKATAKPRRISEVEGEGEHRRRSTGDKEFDRVIGGGIVAGSLVLIGGEPGIGKSTLMLQIALRLEGQRVLYVSGEESEHQIRLRAERLGKGNEECYVLAETQTELIFQQIEALEPDLLIIDSVQTLQSPLVSSAAGSISQVREATSELMRFAKESDTPVFLIGHITKEGSLAGPKVLEHMVDTVLQFEGDRHLTYRILRTTKNRFGSTSELGIYEMQGSGLREVSNPSEILISQRDGEVSGVTIGATLEGNRPLLIEIQSLVSPATYGTPQRTSTGFDLKRLAMLLAVLEKRGGKRLGTQDVFLNIAGGLKVEDPALDLAVCVSILSSFEEVSVPHKTCFAAEVGLGGEIRAVNRIDSRVAEAERLGFEEIFISNFNSKGLDMSRYGIKVTAVGKLSDVYQRLFN